MTVPEVSYYLTKRGSNYEPFPYPCGFTIMAIDETEDDEVKDDDIQ